MRCVEITYDKKDTKLLRCESMASGVSLKLMHQSEVISKELSIEYLSQGKLLQRIIDGKLFGYVQLNTEVPEYLRRYFSNFRPILKTSVVSREDIGTLMREDAEKLNIIVQPRRMLISSFHLINGTLITLILLFYLKH